VIPARQTPDYVTTSSDVKWGVTSKSYQAADIHVFDLHDEKLFSATLRVSGLTTACIICCRMNVTLDMILGIEDIVISWVVIFSSTRHCFVIRMLAYIIHCKHLR